MTGSRSSLGTTWAAAILLVLRAGPAAAQPAPETAPPPAALTVVVDFEAKDTRGRPVSDLTAAEIEIVHGAEKQRLGILEPGDAPGQYRLSYVPLSGQSAAVYLRCLRPNTRILGPEGGGLKPRIVAAPSADEAARTAELDAALRETPADVDFALGVFLFEASPDGIHHTVAVEIVLATLLADPGLGLSDGRLRILARLTAEGLPDVRWLTFDQAIDLPPNPVQRLVWTGDFHLAPGRYALDVLVTEVSSGRAGVRTTTVDAPRPHPVLRMSDVVLLHPQEVLLARTGGDDDPLFFGGAPLMPNLGVALPIGTGARVRFFVVLYPTSDGGPTTLEAELLRGETRVGAAPLDVPPPDERGEIRYVGELVTATFRPFEYTLRLVARQGEAALAREARFVMHDPSEAAALVR